MSARLWFMVACGVLIVLVSGGLRQSFGVFLKPVTTDLQAGREVFGLVIALQALIYGVAQPVIGALADRFGAIRIIVGGATLYAVGLYLTSLSTTAWHLYASLGVMVGLGLSGATQVVVLGALGKVIPDARRSVVFGTVIAATSLGMFLLVPTSQMLIATFDWRVTFVLAAALLCCVPLLATGLQTKGVPRTARQGQAFGAALREARGHSGYVLLTLGFFVCGFHVTFVGTHLPAFLADEGVSPEAAAYALGLIGLANVAGAYLFGALGDRYSKKNLLTGLYAARAVLMAGVLVVPMTDTVALLFGCLMGLLWLSTVPLTSSIVAQIFGTEHFSMLFGVVFMSHQFGSFCGAWLGGFIYDRTGSYDLMWAAAIGFGLVAAALHFPIREQPIARTAAV
ncbi:MAG: MFS transporter [Pseudomonadota bacterium]